MMVSQPFPNPAQHLNLTTWPGGMREAEERETRGGAEPPRDFIRMHWNKADRAAMIVPNLCLAAGVAGKCL